MHGCTSCRRCKRVKSITVLCKQLSSLLWQVLAAANSVVGLANYAWCGVADGRPAEGGLGALSRQPANPELPLQLLI